MEVSCPEIKAQMNDAAAAYATLSNVTPTVTPTRPSKPTVKRRGSSPLFEKKYFRKAIRRLVTEKVGRNNIYVSNDCARKLQKRTETGLGTTIDTLIKAKLKEIAQREHTIEIDDYTLEEIVDCEYESDTRSAVCSDSDGGLDTEIE